MSKESGVGLGTVRATVSEYKKSGTVSSPNKKKVRPTILEKVNDFNKNVIRQKIHGFWLRHEIPTLNKIVQAVKDDVDLPNISRTSMHRLLKDLSFECTKRNRNCALTEKKDLVLSRRYYLESIRLYRQEGRTIYYLGETWVNMKEYNNKVWINKTAISDKDASLKELPAGSKNSANIGKRLIVVHIGSSEGFVPGGLLCFESKNNSFDHQNEIDSNKFYKWFCSILPLLNEESVIVMDNAPYHCKKIVPLPNDTWRKTNIIRWLESKGEVIDRPLVKFQLLEKVETLRPIYDKYEIDEEAKKHNKIVLHLMSYHCELNPIELAWSAVKNYIKMNITYKLHDIRQLLINGVERISPEMWATYVSNTIKEEEKFWQIDFLIDDILEEIENQESIQILTITERTSSDLSEDSD